jgi:hypothetical protein
MATNTYNPALHTTTNKPLSPSGVPTDARSYMWDLTISDYRPFQSTTEVLQYLNTVKFRKGHFDIYVNVGGNIEVFWFRNGQADTDLVMKYQANAGDQMVSFTSNSTTPTIATAIAIPSNTVGVIEVTASCKNNDLSKVGAGKKYLKYKKTVATIESIGINDDPVPFVSDGVSNPDDFGFDIIVSGTDLAIEVTGDTVSMDWTFRIKK